MGSTFEDAVATIRAALSGFDDVEVLLREAADQFDTARVILIDGIELHPVTTDRDLMWDLVPPLGERRRRRRPCLQPRPLPTRL